MTPDLRRWVESWGTTATTRVAGSWVGRWADREATRSALEGANGSRTRAGAHVRTDVPVCHLGDRLRDVCDRLDESGWDTCFVVNEHRVVLGRVGRRAILHREDVSAEDAMTLGPSTIKPSARLTDMVEWMRTHTLTNLPVTANDGRLVGLLTRQDAEQAVRALKT
jgi:Mg/Co/Ni transporter MgtE